MTGETKTRLAPVEEKFILHWGEMGTRWGINRTVAQVHALLFLSPQPVSHWAGKMRKKQHSRPKPCLILRS
jgi:DNA-binding transcriptional regulator GbsR (MarR family)